MSRTLGQGCVVKWAWTFCQQGLDMDTINALLDTIKKTRSLPSDNALALSLGATRQAVSNWRKGRNQPDAVLCARIADAAGVPLNVVLGIVGEARAISRDEKAVWHRLAQMAVVMALATGLLTPGPARAHFAEKAGVCLLCQRIRRWLAGHGRLTPRSGLCAAVS